MSDYVNGFLTVFPQISTPLSQVSRDTVGKNLFQ